MLLPSVGSQVAAMKMRSRWCAEPPATGGCRERRGTTSPHVVFTPLSASHLHSLLIRQTDLSCLKLLRQRTVLQAVSRICSCTLLTADLSVADTGNTLDDLSRLAGFSKAEVISSVMLCKAVQVQLRGQAPDAVDAVGAVCVAGHQQAVEVAALLAQGGRSLCWLSCWRGCRLSTSCGLGCRLGCRLSWGCELGLLGLCRLWRGLLRCCWLLWAGAGAARSGPVGCCLCVDGLR